jgi:hypothetical protein
MPTVKTVLKKTHQEVVIKVAGTAAAQTIDLASGSDMLAAGQALDGATQTVNIVGVTWTGAAGGIITIGRGEAGATTIMTLQANSSNQLDLGGQQMVPDTTDNTTNIVVTISGAQSECWLKLRKVGGYKTTIETANFGIYDNPALPGS